MNYQKIIVGSGAAGLYFAAACPAGKGLILEKTSAPGQKLLLSGNGQCNLTHGGSIKEFINHYGPAGKRIRSALYKHNNQALMNFFTDQGMELLERPDGKVFPRCLDAGQVLALLLRLSRKNGWQLKTECPATSLALLPDGMFLINGELKTQQVIIATGGCSYPATGSDGSMFPILAGLGLEIIAPRPALVPITVQDYPYEGLQGISFPNALVRIDGHPLTGPLLLTHSSFSGPAVLDQSRYARPGSLLEISYVPEPMVFPETSGNRQSTAVFLAEKLALPKRFVEIILKRAGIEPEKKAAALSGKEQNRVIRLLTCDSFSISGTSGFSSAMATRGGVSLDEMDLKTFACKKYPGLFVIGEALDVDGDTGGYNLQFAFSSANCAAAAAKPNKDRR